MRIAILGAIVVLLIAAIWMGQSEMLRDAQQPGVAANGASLSVEAVHDSAEGAAAIVESSADISVVTDGSGLEESADAGGANKSSAVQVWSEAPEVIESRILEEISSERYGVLWDQKVTCTETQCSIQYVRSAPGNIPLRFVPFLRSAAIGASGVSVRWERRFDGTYLYTHEVTTSREAPPDDYKGLGMTADELKYFSGRFLATEDLYAAPVVLDVPGDETVKMVIENICSIECPLDAQQILHWTSEDGLPCEREGPGVPREFLVRTENGFFEQRMLCVEVPYDEALSR